MTDLFAWAETHPNDAAEAPATVPQAGPADAPQPAAATPPADAAIAEVPPINAAPETGSMTAPATVPQAGPADAQQPAAVTPPADAAITEAPPINAAPEAGSVAAPIETTPKPPGPWQPPREGAIPENFADALDLLRASGRFAPQTITCWTAEVKQGAKIMRLTPSTIPTRPAALVPLLEAVLPDRRGGLSAKRWANIRTTLKAIAIHVGAHAPREATRAALTGSWVDLITCVPFVPQKTTMAGFARFCQASGIPPEMASEADLQAYASWRRAATYSGSLLSTIGGIRSLWNRCRRRIPGWPGMEFVAAGCSARRRISPQLDTLHPDMRRDFEAYIAGLTSPSNPFGGRARALAPDTVRLHHDHLLRATALRAQQLGGLHHIRSIADLANPAAMKDILVAVHAGAGNAWTPSAPITASILVTAARYHLGLDDEALKPMRALQSRVGGRRTARLTEKVRARLATFDDARIRRDLLSLPRVLCERAEALRKTRPKHAAALHRRGIALQLLFLAALRRRNLAAVDVATDLLRDEKGRPVGLRIDGSKTKNGVAIDAAFDPWFTRTLQRHLTVHRPVLPGADTTWLFPSPTTGSCMSREGLANSITHEVQAELGVRFNLHLTRHLIATLLFEQDTDNSLVVQRVLGHTTVKATDRMYGDLRTRGAQVAWGAIVDQEVRRARKRRGGG